MKNLLLTLTCLLLAAQIHASERYRVEVMIFAYLDENSAREEHWPLLEQWKQEEADAINTQLLMAEDTNEIIIEDTELNTDAVEEEIIEKPVIQPLDTLEFADPAARFRYRNDISMLWHQAWVEEIQNADAPIIH
ncbi:MAG: CsiV family protein, partial [Thalassolituus sp.]